MLLRTAIVGVALIGSLATVANTGVAQADPGEPILCNFTMSDPYVTDLSGVQMVTATTTPAACTGTAKPTSSQVCLSTADSIGRCSELPGYTAAQAYLSPYRPGVAYTVTGRGCAAVTTPPTYICTTLGPRTVTL
jgi:hypothetical protein